MSQHCLSSLDGQSYTNGTYLNTRFKRNPAGVEMSEYCTVIENREECKQSDNAAGVFLMVF